LFTRFIGPEELVQLLNEGDYKEAAILWDKLRPLLVSLADNGTPTHNAWWHLHSTSGLSIPRPFSSIREFERVVLNGGWPSLGTSMRDTWKIPAATFNSHAGTARAWEGFLIDTVRNEKNPIKIKPLSKSVKTIKAKCEDHMAKIPWITG
jgi:hypothetical protein